MIKFKYVTAPDIARLKAWINNLPHAVDEVLKESADNIQKAAREGAPYKTGALRAGIVVIRISNGYMVYASVAYSRWQEEGTSRGIHPKRYMYNAMVSESERLIGYAVNKLKFN